MEKIKRDKIGQKKTEKQNKNKIKKLDIINKKNKENIKNSTKNSKNNENNNKNKLKNKKNNEINKNKIKKIKKNSNANKKFSKKQKIMLILSGLVIGFLNGFFGGGGGMICVPILQKVLELDAKRSHATAIMVIFPLSLISAFIYVINGYISSLPLLTIGLGVVAGGIFGSFALKFLPPKAIRLIFAIIMFAGGIKLII